MNFHRLLTAFAALIGVFVFGHSPAFAQLFTVLLGGNEVSDAGAANAGDPDGGGTATVLIGDTDPTLCYAILVTGIDTPTAAHIHEAAAGTNGPIVVPLDPPDAGDPGQSSDCITDADAAVVDRIRKNPLGFYVNVHNDAYPTGAVRGQLFGGVFPGPQTPPPPPAKRSR
jgi:CHRD domain